MTTDDASAHDVGYGLVIKENMYKHLLLIAINVVVACHHINLESEVNSVIGRERLISTCDKMLHAKHRL